MGPETNCLRPWPGELAFPVMEKVYGMEFAAVDVPLLRKALESGIGVSSPSQVRVVGA